MTTAAPKISHIYNPANMSPQELIDNFVVRQSLFQRLFEALKTAPMEQPEQHYIVVGPRGSGKSTLLQRLYYEVQRDPDLSQRVIPILFPEEQYQIVSLARLWENVLEELDRKPGFAGVYRDFEAGLAGVEGGDEEEYAFERLDQALQARSRKAILFLENIGDLLARFSDQEHQRLRERLLTCADLRIVGGSAVVLEHTYCYSQPLFDFFQFEYLRELNQQEIYALLASLARRYNEEHVARILREQPERVEILRRLTGGIPRTIVLLFEIFAESEDGDSFKDLEQVLDLVTPLYKHRMEEGLTPARQQIIDCVAMNWDALTVPEIASKLRIAVTDGPKRDALVIDVEELVKNSLLQRVSEPAPEPLYQIAERFFNIWYLMRHGRHGDRNRVRWFVRFLEAWCSPQDLEARARKHLSMLQTQNVDPQYAVNVTQALANTRLDSELQDSLIRSTRSLLELKDASLLDDLSPSDNELFADAKRAYEARQFDQALSLFKQVAIPSARTLLGCAICCAEIRDYNSAEQYYELALKEDPDHAYNPGASWQRDLSVSYERLGDLAVAQGDLAAASRSFTQSLTIRERLSGSDPANAEWQRNLSVSLNKLGGLATAQGDLPAALRYFTQSLNIRERLASSDPANAAWQRDLSVSLNKLGDLATAQGDLPAALRYFTQSLSIFERLASSDPANAAWQRDLSVSHEKLGDLATAQGDLPAALRYFTQSLSIFERLASSDPANAAWQRDLSVSLNKLGDLATAQGDLPAALRYFTQSLSIFERLASSDPANAAWQRDLSVSLNKLGDLATAQGDLPAALRYFTEALRIAERLASSDPANAAWQRDLSVSLNKLGDLATSQGDLPAALRYFTQSLNIRERLASSDPANAAWQRDLSVSLNKLGDLATAQGDLPAALRYFTEGLRIAERLASSDPANASWQRDLSVSYERLGDLAAFMELLHDYDQAKHLYRRAIELGNGWAIDRLVRMYFTQGRSRETALEYSTLLILSSPEPAQQFRHAAILVWNLRREEATALVNTVLPANTELEPLDELRDFLLMLIAARAYEDAWTLFSEPTYKLKDRYRPVYYALLHFVRDRHRSEYQRMGSELKETVEELVERIKQWRQTYFPEG